MEIIRVAGEINPFNGATSRSYVVEMPAESSQAFKQYGFAAAELYAKRAEKTLIETIRKNLRFSYGLDIDSKVVQDFERDLNQLTRDIEQARVTLQSSRSGILFLLSRLSYDTYPSVSDIVTNGDFQCLEENTMYEFNYRGKILTIVFVSEPFPA